MTNESGTSLLGWVFVAPVLIVLAVVLEYGISRLGLGLGVVLLAGPGVLAIACVLAGMCWAAGLVGALDAPRKLVIVGVSIAFVMVSFRVFRLFDWIGTPELNQTAPLLGAMVGIMQTGPITATWRRLVAAMSIGAVIGLGVAWWLAPAYADFDDATWVAPRVALVLIHGVFVAGWVARCYGRGADDQGPVP